MVARFCFEALLFATAFASPFNSERRTPVDALEDRSLISKFQTGPGHIPIGEKLEPQLSQQVTNGKSLLGTLDAPRLPVDYLPNPSNVKLSGRASVPPDDLGIGDIPTTGVTRKYDFYITQQDLAPDGVVRPGMVVNGGYPGPTIEANWGDYFQITVHNQLETDEGTSIHWHGLLQNETPYFDGVPGTQQCPIAPGQNLTYTFRADLYGTSFYHSHYSAQYTAGIYGAMIIYGPHDNAQYDEDLGPVLLNDWYHESYYDTLELAMAPISANALPPLSNNNLINGKMNYPCANATGLSCTPNAGISKFQFESGKTYRLRLINSGAEGIQKFSIDGHNLTVIANDFVPLKPYVTDVVTLGIGQRTDIVVKAIGKPGSSYWMRSTLGLSALFSPLGCTLNDGVSPEAVAAVYYAESSTSTGAPPSYSQTAKTKTKSKPSPSATPSSIPTTNSTVPQSKIQTCANDPITQTVPYYTIGLEPAPQTQNIDITFQSNGTNFLFYMNNSTFRADYNNPVLLDAHRGVTHFAPELNVYSSGTDTAMRLVIYNYTPTGAHPMHLHGHNYQVLATGEGTWNGVITNAHNPQRRDVQLLPPAILNSDREVVTPTYIVIQFDIDNPGTWPLHCHIAWHVSAGLYVTILEAPEQIKNLTIPAAVKQTCKHWAAWTSKDVPDQIDSGL